MTSDPDKGPSTSLEINTRQFDGLRKMLKGVSADPGVYLMKDAGGRVIYVGKARNLKKRLTSYFRPIDQLDIKTGVLSKKISSYDTIITRTEKEALIFESTLIKKYKPRYNVILKDDKRYPSLRLDLNHSYPNLTVVRKTPSDGAHYFGPFASAHAVRHSLKFINQTFKLRKCKNREFSSRTRPCLHYQMDACLGPCCLAVDKKRYGKMVREVILFLNGRTPQLIGKIKKRMLTAAVSQQYERAARLRDKIFSLEKTLEKQVAVTTDFQDRDVLAIARSPEVSLITIFSIRGGYIQGSREIEFFKTLSTDTELIRTFIRQYYEKIPFIPGEILVPTCPEDVSLLEDSLREMRGKNVRIRRPRRGKKVKLLDMALQNAENRLKERTSQMEMKKELLTRLRKRLKIDTTPRRIECFDNSNISGTSAVAAMVVFENGSANKSLYRKYQIKTVSQQDDYAYMAEVLGRRYGRGEQSEPFPDLLMVDGGKGQLNIALSVMRHLGIEGKFEVIGIAKKDDKQGETQDKIYKAGRANPVNLGREGDLLLFLQRIRDEAHRFAIGFHRKRRAAAALHSRLDDIPGIGKKRKTALLRRFGGISQIRAATMDELRAVPGMTIGAARAIKKALSP